MIGEKVSVITISFNSVETIEKTLQSILRQKYRPLEYILVDGGSKDGTVELIDSYIRIFKQAGIETNFRSEPDNGISDAFNKGIERATGAIIGITNADDCIELDALNIVAFSFREDADVLCGDCYWNDDTNNISYIRKSKIRKLSKLKYEMVLMHPTCYVRKDAYKKYGMFDCDLRYVMDKDLMARFYAAGAKFDYIPHILATMSAGGVSDTNREKVFEEGVIVAVRNGAPKWFAKLRWKYKAGRMKIIDIAKSKSSLWHLLRKMKGYNS